MPKTSSRSRILLLLAVVVIAGSLVVAVTIGKGVLERRRQKQTAMQLIDVSRLLRDYWKEHRSYPVVNEIDITKYPEIKEMADLRSLSLLDSWGRPLRFESTKRHFLIWSLGKNGKVDRFPGGGRRKGGDVDLVVYDGKFWQLAHGI